MTTYYPLIINTGSSQIQELPSGNDLNLSGSNISNVGAITITSNDTAIVNGGANGVGNIDSRYASRQGMLSDLFKQCPGILSGRVEMNSERPALRTPGGPRIINWSFSNTYD